MSEATGDAPTTNVDLGAVIQSPEHVQFLLSVGEASQAYGSVEQALATIFANLLGAEPAIAGVVFYRIVNTRSRNSIVERLLKKRHGSKHNVFWNSMERLIVSVDGVRNQVIHWHKAINIEAGREPAAMFALVPPNFWDPDENSPNMTLVDIQDFIRKCGFVAGMLNCFHLHLIGHAGLPDAWRDICQQPVTYPPPDSHPLSPKHKAPQTPPAPSQG